jgi:hypothetical protein
VDLRTWLDTPDENGKRRTISAIARAARTTRHVIYDVAAGHVPRVATARRISAATRGAVTVAELLQVDATSEAAA